jgi:polyhydroxyalkanoate synthesis regulator phasin
MKFYCHTKEAAMIEQFEKTVLTGLGFLSLSQKKAEELLKELQERYKLSEEEGKSLLEKVQTTAKEGRQRVEEIAEAEVKKVIDRLGLVPREEFDQLLKRVAQLEADRNEPGSDAPC